MIYGLLVPQLGIEPVPHALEAFFLTTGSPVKSRFLGHFFMKIFILTLTSSYISGDPPEKSAQVSSLANPQTVLQT